MVSDSGPLSGIFDAREGGACVVEVRWKSGHHKKLYP